MPIEIIAVEGLQEEPSSPKEAPAVEEKPVSRRGRPPGAKDRAPRKRPARPPPKEETEESEEQSESEEEPPPRPATRKSGVKRPKRVQIVETESEEELSPRTKRHQEWTAYRKNRADAHQANVNHYARMFDRMLA